MRPFSVLNENAQPRSYIEQFVISLNIFRYDHPSDLVLAGEFLYSKNFFGTQKIKCRFWTLEIVVEG